MSNPQQPQQPTPQQQPPPQQQALQHQQWLHEQNMRAAERAHDAVTDFASKTNTAAVEGANLALRTAMLINGGAAISVLAFIGGLASRDKISLQAITQTAATLVWFGNTINGIGLFYEPLHSPSRLFPRENVPAPLFARNEQVANL